jgi:lysophospholipase L1-like esterase
MRGAERARRIAMELLLRAMAILAGLGCAEAGASALVYKLSHGQAQTVVVYGTSLTQGGAWVGLMQSWLTATYPGPLTIVNSGQGGRASNTGLASLDTLVLANNPDTVFIEFAVNDAYTGYAANDLDYGITLARSASNLNAMIDRIHTVRPSAEIIIQTMNSAWDAPSGYLSAKLRTNLPAYYQGYRNVAQDRGILLIDHYTNWVSLQTTNAALFQAYVPDGVHPSYDGCAAIILPELKATLTNAYVPPPPPARPPNYIIRPASVAASSHFTPDNRNPDNTVNGYGLSTDLETGVAVPPVYPTHNTTHLTTWLSASGGSGTSWIRFELGDTHLLTGFHLWNYNEVVPGYDTAGRGISTGEVRVTTPNGAEIGFGTSTFVKAGATGPQTNYTGETYLFPQPLQASSITITNVSNFGVDGYVGISEIRFLGLTRSPAGSCVIVR